MKIIIETPRLVLRQFTMADAPLILALNSAPGVLQYIHEPGLTNVQEAADVLQNIILPQYANNLGRWAVHTRHNNDFIGWCGLKWLQSTNEIDLGYRFTPPHWGKGYATEAAQHTLNYGLHQLNLQEIFGKAHIDNTASQNVLEKIGMQYVKEIMEDKVQVKVYRATESL
ncbi:GNAT family N-acetyltransferase [Ferruginibacter paludis]|uniref:GNAT family N-acetyltransferase n=1 Tax=Ferruginibacter paludis TaxID=1310417 RepID=UPI0025B5CBFF|nr:GNAT family N-acetyltransferase [Ferruginibacter paludis]MDN3658268.1 GNAT family N-acetyltransferase [Ferruginibacter paludis]